MEYSFYDSCNQGRLHCGARGVAAPSMGGAGRARIALDTELFPSILPSEEAFSDFVDSLLHENSSGGKPTDPKLPWCC